MILTNDILLILNDFFEFGILSKRFEAKLEVNSL